MKRRQFLKIGALSTGAGALLSSYPFFIERYIVQVNTYKIPVPDLPKAFDNFRILHLTDLHLGPLVQDYFIDDVIQKSNALPKEMIVCTGDYVNKRDSSGYIDQVWPLIAKLKARYGVFNVLGNHDHWADFDRSLYWLNQTGQNIRHQAKAIEKDGQRIWIAGAGDLWEDKIGIDQALQNVPDNECRIVLAHNPDTADEAFQQRVDLMICGHTHGGQVKIPFIGAPILPVENKKYSSGFIRSEKTNLFISRGIGWAIIPVRFNCYPEIAILQLVQAT